MEKTEELVYPYCGTCGHRYFHLNKVKENEAILGPCLYCIEDEIEDRKLKKLRKSDYSNDNYYAD